MPDIGLLQGSRPRVVAAPASAPDGEMPAAPAVAPTREVAAPFIAPVASAIAVMSAPLATEVVSDAIPATHEQAPPPREDDVPRHPATPPSVTMGGVPPVRLSDLLWLACFAEPEIADLQTMDRLTIFINH